MTVSTDPNASSPGDAQRIATVRLVGFSSRDADLLRVFFRRPTQTGAALEITDAIDADLLLANMSQPEAVMAVRRFKQPGRTIGLVQQFATDAAFYQVQQNAQLLYSLAQAVNRLREGWYPPHLQPPSVAPTVGTTVAGAPDAVPPAHADDAASEADPDGAAAANSATAPDAATSGATAVSVTSPTTAEFTAAAPSVSSVSSVASTATTASSTAPMATAGLSWQRAMRILVIDDSKFSRVSIQEALTKIGFSVDTAVDGEEGVRMAGEALYDVALIDFEMPGIKGPETIRRLRLLGVNTPQLLIMLTSRTGAVDRLRAKLAGCDAYLTKPTKMSEFVAVLTQFASQGKLKRG